jgi:hypothetical protein
MMVTDATGKIREKIVIFGKYPWFNLPKVSDVLSQFPE